MTHKNLSFILKSNYLHLVEQIGNLIARPKLHMPITNVEDMLAQDEISLVVEEGVAIIDYMEASPKGSTLRELSSTATRLSDDGELGAKK